MKKIFFLLVAVILTGGVSYAVTVYPYPVTVSTPSGAMTIFLQGNEHCKYALTDDGYPLLQNSQGWYFASVGKEGQFSASAFRAEAKELRDEKLCDFLEKESKKLERREVCDVQNVEHVILGMDMHSMVENDQTEQNDNAPMYVPNGSAVVGERKALVVLVQFADVKFTKSKNDFYNLFNQAGYYDDGAKGSVYDFYAYASHGKLNLHSDIVGPFNLQYPMAYYGGNSGWGGKDNNPYAMFAEALEKVRQTVDVAEYDQDNDGLIDNFHIVYAGYGEEAGASSDAIWAHEANFSPIDIGGIKINGYSCAPELRSNKGDGITRIGSHCHEMGHALGAKDYYDTNYDTDGRFSGTGVWDVMASGSWNDDGVSPANFNPYVKAFDYGWCEVVDITKDTTLQISPSSVEDRVFKLRTDNDNDYFLLENRQQESFDASVPGHGLLVYHIGEAILDGMEKNTINAAYPQGCYLVCASSEYRKPSSLPASYGDINSSGCPFPGTSCKTEFSDISVPAALCVDGSWTGFSLSYVSEDENKSVNLSVKMEGDGMNAQEPKAEGEMVWSEMFSDVFLSSFWSQKIIEGKSKWEICRSMNIMDTNRWLQITPTLSSFDSDTRTVVQLESSVLNLEDDDYVLSFKVAGSDSGAKGINDVTIRFLREGVPVENEKRVQVVSEVWAQHSVAIDRSLLPLQFTITGTCYANSTLKIDDVNICKRYSEATALKSVDGDNVNKKVNKTVYTVGGMKFDAPLLPNHYTLYIKGGKKYVVY